MQTKILETGQPHFGEVGGEFPRILYKPADAIINPETKLPLNVFHGHACDTVIVETLDDMETLLADGWSTTPGAAYGAPDRIAEAASAKDARIAELEALVAGMTGSVASEPDIDRPRRGRPPKIIPDINE